MIGDDLEKQFSGHFGQRDIAQFIDDDQFHVGPACQHACEALVALCFDQLVYQSGRGSEANASALSAGGDGQAGCQMCFSCSRFADQKHWFGV